VFFSGLCHFVENREQSAKVKMCVVLPEADKHDGAIKLQRGGLSSPTGEAKQSIELRRHRVAFRFDKDSKQLKEPLEFGGDAMKGVIPMRDIAGIFADENPSIVRAMPPKEVRAQIILDRGKFRVEEKATPFKFPGTLRNEQGEIAVDLADKMFADITVPGEFVEIIVTSIGNKAKIDAYVLKPDANGEAVIDVSNDCVPPPGEPLKAEDLDFQFHYKLLSPEATAAMKRRLGKSKIPLPVNQKMLKALQARAEAGGGTGPVNADVGCNCVKSYGNMRFIGLNTFVPSDRSGRPTPTLSVGK
jgi:hypothetical protein